VAAYVDELSLAVTTASHKYSPSAWSMTVTTIWGVTTPGHAGLVLLQACAPHGAQRVRGKMHAVESRPTIRSR
jgi:hypothetical protein